MAIELASFRSSLWRRGAILPQTTNRWRPNSIGNSLTELKTTFAKYDASNQAYDRAGLDRVMADLHKQITDVEKILQAIEPEK